MSEQDRFHSNMIDLSRLIHELISICYDEGKTKINPKLIELAEGFLDAYNKNDLLVSFIEKSHLFWDQIHIRDESFFSKNCKEVFKDLPLNHSDQIDAFKTLYESKDDSGEYLISQDDKDAVWNYFDSLIKISIKHIHKKRCPKIMVISNDKKPAYTQNAFPYIKKLQYYARINNVKLEWTQQ